MKRIIQYFILSACIVAVMGCSAKNNPTDQNPPAQEKTDPSANTAALKESIDATNAAYDEDLIKKIRDSETPPPRLQTSVEVLETDHITATDAERSWFFQQSSFERCYGIAVAKDDTVKGEAVVSLKRDQGKSQPEMTSLTTDIKQEGFEACLKAAPLRWRIPEGSSTTLRIKFNTLPGLTAAGMADLVPDHRHADPMPAQDQNDVQAPLPADNAVPAQE